MQAKQVSYGMFGIDIKLGGDFTTSTGSVP